MLIGEGLLQVLAAAHGVSPQEELETLTQREKQIMEEKKDCKIVFLDKTTYEFKFDDLPKAIAWSEGRKVWVIKTPYGIFQPMDMEEYENVFDAVMGDHDVFPDSSQEDLK